MKTLKINQLEKNTLDARAMSQVKGGAVVGYCGCGCASAGSGGSSIASNADANALGGLKSPGGRYKRVIYILDEVVVRLQ